MFTPYLNPNPKTRQIAKQTTEEEAAARISFRLEELFEQVTLAVEATNSLLLESILRELTLLNDIKCSLTDPDSSSEPLRAIIEFLDGDVDRPPRVFPMAGSMEGDGELCRGIKRRWKTAE